MNYARTAILLAGLTGLFMAVGYLIGGPSGALIALIIAAGPICSVTGTPTSLCYRCTTLRRLMTAARRNLWRSCASWHSALACRCRGSI